MQVLIYLKQHVLLLVLLIKHVYGIQQIINVLIILLNIQLHVQHMMLKMDKYVKIYKVHLLIIFWMELIVN